MQFSVFMLQMNRSLRQRINPKKCLILILIFLLGVLMLLNTEPKDISTQVYYYLYPEKSIFCYRMRNEQHLEDISHAKIRKGKSIFFHETSCRSYDNGKIIILPRQACAVESAARMNPNSDIYLTFSSPGIMKRTNTESDRILQRLLEYKNINIRYLNYENYTKNTPLEELYSKGKLEFSSYAQSHASDILRYLTLYKYGGIYLDMDVVVIRSLEDLKPNYAGLETDNNVAAGVISFDYKGIGHELAERCVTDLKYNFKSHGWGDNGPGVITRLLKKICNVKRAKDMLNKDCSNFTVYPAHMFYPITFVDWKLYFTKNDIAKVFRKAKDSYVLHMWNRVSENTKVPLQTETAYTLFAQKFCPKTYQECDNSF